MSRLSPTATIDTATPMTAMLTVTMTVRPTGAVNHPAARKRQLRKERQGYYLGGGPLSVIKKSRRVHRGKKTCTFEPKAQPGSI
jgi:hypothetical protein